MARHCGKCGRTGHYTPTCGTKAKSKRGVVRKRGTSRIASRRGRSLFGVGSGWLVLYHGGATGETQHDKTWAVKIVNRNGGYSVVTRHGRRTGQKNETVRKSTSLTNANQLAQRLINQKLRKGYHLLGYNRKKRKA